MDESSSDSEDEDDEGMLATEDVDAEIFATLDALRSKDPRVYDKTATFYKERAPEALPGDGKKDKPMYLRDYHRKILLEDGADNVDTNKLPQTYDQEQRAFKNQLVKSMHHAVGKADAEEDKGGSDEDFIKPKPGQSDTPAQRHKRTKPADVDVAVADKDPERFLTNLMTARAWVPDVISRFQPFESDDEEEEARAEAFEEAYNMRFEDPARANEKLMGHARDAAAKYSARREELHGRRKQRDREREKKAAVKAERQEEKMRLRKLKIDEAEEKLKRIKDAAGLRGKSLSIDEWASLLEEGWDDDKWDEEMKKRFGDAYYKQVEESSASGEESATKSKRKRKKPKWNEDIDIKDLVPDFEEDDTTKPKFTLSDEEDKAMASNEAVEAQVNEEGKDQSKKGRAQERHEQKRQARKERQKIEQMVDDSLDLEVRASSSNDRSSRFRYRDTSPTTFGLTARDILLADDTQLNQYVGLKKLVAFRDPERKKKDKKKLSKKARLRQWRKETFGDENGPSVADGGGANGAGEGEGQVEDKKKSKKRSRKRKAKDAVET